MASRKWTGWHLLMFLLILGFAVEMSLLFREIRWIGSATQAQITWVKNWEGQRDRYLIFLGNLFWQRLIKYAGAVIILGFGLFNCLWQWSRRVFGVVEVQPVGPAPPPPLYPDLEKNVTPEVTTVETVRNDKKERRAAGLFFFLFLLFFRLLIPLLSDLVHGLMLGDVWGQLSWYNLMTSVINSALLSSSVYILSGHFARKPVEYLAWLLIVTTLLTLSFNGGLWWLTPRLSDRLWDFPDAMRRFKGIWDVCSELGFPTSKIFYSSWTNGNAFASGVGPLAHIVIGEDLLTELKPVLLTAIVAHELGHWRHHHVICTLLIMFVALIGILALTWLLFTRPVNFGLEKGSASSRLSHTLCFMFLLSIPLVSILLRPLYNLLSWSMELAADRHAGLLGYAQPLMVALSQLSKYTIGRSINSTLFSIFYSSHPPNNVRFYMLTKLKGIKV